MKTHRFIPIVRRPGEGAYSLVEVLVAAGLLSLAVGAAASLSLTTVSQEEANFRQARAQCYLENAVQLYRLGVAPDNVAGLLPEEPEVIRLGLVTDTTSVTGLGNLEFADITLEYRTSPAGETPLVSRSETVRVYRETVPRVMP